MKGMWRILVGFAVIALVAGMLVPAQGQPQRLMVYGAIHETEIAKMLEAFTKATGIPAEFIRGSSGELVARIKAERASPKADVKLGGPADSHEALALEGLLMPYIPPESKNIDRRFRSPLHYWHGFYLGALGIAINKPRFDKELKPKGVDYPRTWEDLLNHAFKGEIVVANPATSGTAFTFVATQLQRLGWEKGWEYLTAFHKNVNHYTRSGAAPANMAATGEFIIGIAFGHDILKPAKQGYPVMLIYPPDTGWEIGAVSIIKRGPNPEAAKKFVNWVLTREAGKLHTEISLRISVRPDVPVPEGVIPISQIKLLKNYDLSWAARERNRILAEWERRFK